MPRLRQKASTIIYHKEAAGNMGSSYKRPTLMREFWVFLSQHKKWWLMPLLAVILLLGFLVIMSGSPVAAYIYTLF